MSFIKIEAELKKPDDTKRIEKELDQVKKEPGDSKPETVRDTKATHQAIPTPTLVKPTSPTPTLATTTQAQVEPQGPTPKLVKKPKLKKKKKKKSEEDKSLEVVKNEVEQKLGFESAPGFSVEELEFLKKLKNDKDKK